MEISKENIFKREYTSIFGQAEKRKEKIIRKINNFIIKNKLIGITIIIFLISIIFNFVLIYNFIRILENI